MKKLGAKIENDKKTRKFFFLNFSTKIQKLAKKIT